MNWTYAAMFGLAGGIAGSLVHLMIERQDDPKDPKASGFERLWVVTASTIVPFALCFKFQQREVALVYGMLSLVLIGVAVFDLRKKVIPLWVTVPGVLAGIAVSTWLLPIGFRNSSIGMILGAGILLFTTTVEALRHKDVGGGDWKLAAMVGSFLGPNRTITAMLAAGVIGLLTGLILWFRPSSTKPAALGPFLSAGAILSMFWN